MLKLFHLILLIFCSYLLNAQVFVYPSLGKQVQTSPYFKVKINQDGQQFTSFVNFWQATSGDLARSTSWTTFSFQNKITVEVEVLGGLVRECVVRPLNDSIQAKIDGNIIRFELAYSKKITLEINGDKKKVLFIFADPPEENVPAENEKGLWSFKSGVYDIGVIEVPDSVKHIYIAGGALLKGAFVNNNRASNFKITGRGILSSIDLEQIPRIIKCSGEGLNVYIEGITMCNENSGGVEVTQSYSTIRNCKILGWNEKSDGVECGEHALVEDCFFRCGGDALKLYNSYFIAQNCVFWQNETGASFQFGWNLKGDFHNFRVVNCDVVCCEQNIEAYNAAIFSAVHGGPGNLSNYLFDDIRIEGDVYRLFKLTIRTNVFVKDVGYGTISSVHFKNISLQGECLMANEIWGYNQQHVIRNVTFEKVKTAGREIRSANDGNFKINLNTSSSIVFK